MTETEKYIHSLPKMKKLPGLSALKKVLEGLGSPQNKLKFIHIAGTNGKGSVTSYICKALEENGYTCGRFISPYILCFYERISVNGVFITDEELTDIVEKIKTLKVEGLTEFELITACALYHYASKNCDFAVLEAGIGGKNDATNIIPPPLCAVLTKIGLDHMAILGDTVEEIAKDKCGIIKNGPAVTYPLQNEDALKVINQYCEPVVPDISKLEITYSGFDGNEFIYKGEKYSLALGGEHQIYNALTAIEALNLSKIKLSKEKTAKALSETRFPARLEVFKGEPDIVLDGAHNADGMATLCKAVKDFAKGRKTVVITGVFKDKDYKDEMAMLKNIGDLFITVTPPGERALDAAALGDILGKAEVFGTDFEGALSWAKKQAGKNGLVIICGSLYLASDMRKFLI